jgi:hypothetical protein
MTTEELHKRASELSDILGLKLHSEHWIVFEAIRQLHDELTGGENELP